MYVCMFAYNIIHSYSRTIHVIYLQKCTKYTFSTLTYFCCYWLQLMPPFLSAPKGPNRSVVKGLAAAAGKLKAAG